MRLTQPVLLLCFLAFLFASTYANADPLKTGYLDKLLDSATVQNHLTAEADAEGKRIEKVVIVPYDIISPFDPLPQWLNGIHVTTKQFVVERELLFKAGDVWTQSLIEETQRNLRANLYVSTAVIIACKGSTPDQVIALVMTKDLWSLRPSADFLIVGGVLQYFDLHLAENNLAGEKKKIGVDFRIDLDTYLAGERYSDPRLFGSRTSFSESADLIWNRNTNLTEGLIGSLAVERPLFSLSTEWAGGIWLDYLKDVYRLYANGAIAQVQSPTTGELVNYEFNRSVFDLRTGVTRSVGTQFKNDVTVGWRALLKTYTLYDAPPTFQAASLADFANYDMPRSENAGMLYASYRAYLPQYTQLTNIERFALPEDYHLGPDFTTEVRLANSAFGFNSNYFEPRITGSYQWLLRDDLLTLKLVAIARYQPELGFASSWVDETVGLTVRNVTPIFWFFRLFSSLRIQETWQDLDHNLLIVGGDTSLRGFPSASFFGPESWGANLEIRTQPWIIHTLYMGAVAFYDAGDAEFSTANFNVHSSVGFGIRTATPQFNRQVFRLDIAFPLQALPSGISASYVTLSFGQAFD